MPMCKLSTQTHAHTHTHMYTLILSSQQKRKQFAYARSKQFFTRTGEYLKTQFQNPVTTTTTTRWWQLAENEMLKRAKGPLCTSLKIFRKPARMLARGFFTRVISHIHTRAHTYNTDLAVEGERKFPRRAKTRVRAHRG